jgi:ubiquitin
MALEDLVASQPEEEVSPSSQDQTVMEDQQLQGEEASETPVNSDGEQVTEDSDIDENSRYQKRIDKLTRRAREAEEQLLQEKAAREAIERNMDHFSSSPKEQTLADLDVAALKQFIISAEGDESLEKHIPEARELIQEKTIEEKLKAFEDQRASEQQEQEGKQLTNVMLDNLSGGKLKDPDGDYFHAAQQNLYDLDNKFKNVNVKQLLAVALAENDWLKSQKSGPSVIDRVVDNRNKNTIMANNRAINAGTQDLNDFLKGTGGRLSRSSQGEEGSLRQAIKKLGVVKSFEGE